MTLPFHANQIGSLLRPDSLLQARSSSNLSSPSQIYTSASANVEDLTNTAVKEVIDIQLAKDIRPLTNGEYPRSIFYSGFFEKLSGFTVYPDQPLVPSDTNGDDEDSNEEIIFRTDFPTHKGLINSFNAKTRSIVLATSKIVYDESKPAYLPEWLALRSILPSQNLWKQCKITMPSITYQHIQLKPNRAWTTSSNYTSDREYFTDLAHCYRSEMKILYSHGVRDIQIDDPNLSYFCDEAGFLSGARKDHDRNGGSVNTDELWDLYVWAHNLCLRDRPADLRVGIHLCRGNMTGSFSFLNRGVGRDTRRETSFERIAEKMFRDLEYETFYLEFDRREGDGDEDEFECLKYLPKGKNVVLGLVSTKVVEMEKVEDVVAKIHKAAGIVAEAQCVSEREALASLGVSPQCGFSSSSVAGGKGMTTEKMWEKLELVRDVGRQVWGENA